MATLKEQLELHEGIRKFPYQDTVGKWTIGVGRNLTDKGISDTTIAQMLDEDLIECIADLGSFSWFSSLDYIRQRVLIDMRFNLGSSGFRGFKNTLKAVGEGRYIDASNGMLASKWAKQTKTRAVRLAIMMRDGKDYDSQI